MMHWREWKAQKREQEQRPPKPRRNTSTLAPLTPSSPTPTPQQGTLKDFLTSIPQPATTVTLYDDFQSACTLFSELTPMQRILEAAGHRTISPLYSTSLNAVKCGILLSAALEGDVFDLA